MHGLWLWPHKAPPPPTHTRTHLHTHKHKNTHTHKQTTLICYQLLNARLAAAIRSRSFSNSPRPLGAVTSDCSASRSATTSLKGKDGLAKYQAILQGGSLGVIRCRRVV